ncbi:hypothetical protein [Rheinheimera sp. KL1]|nr:hypothetical protein [Rheinheimera sp. KL1]
MDKFDAAILAGNQEEAISLLLRVELSREAAIETVAAIVENPGKYGYANR